MLKKMKKNNSHKKLEIPGPEKIGGIHENISNPGGKEPNLTPEPKIIPGPKIEISKLNLGKTLSFNDVVSEIKTEISKTRMQFIENNYPLAYDELLTELKYTGNSYQGKFAKPFQNLFDFFDKRGIMVEIAIDYTRVGYGSPLFCFKVGVFEEEKIPKNYSSLYRSREEATNEAFEEAFRLLNEELHSITLENVYRLYPGCTINGVEQFYDGSWNKQLRFLNIDLARERNRFSPLMQTLFCYREGANMVQFSIVHETQKCYPDYKIKELLN